MPPFGGEVVGLVQEVGREVVGDLEGMLRVDVDVGGALEEGSPVIGVAGVSEGEEAVGEVVTTGCRLFLGREGGGR